jgi:hypothetical protein
MYLLRADILTIQGWRVGMYVTYPHITVDLSGVMCWDCMCAVSAYANGEMGHDVFTTGETIQRVFGCSL